LNAVKILISIYDVYLALGNCDVGAVYNPIHDSG